MQQKQVNDSNEQMRIKTAGRVVTKQVKASEVLEYKSFARFENKRANELFEYFTANIIKEDVTFIR